MRNLAISLSFALALTACASTEEPASVAVQPEGTAPQADPLESAPAFAVATLAPGRPGCTADTVRDRAIIGIQTEAMMTALACGQRYGNPKAYADYRAMTATHADLLAGATRALMREYGKGKDGVRKFDIEHTRVSNQIAMTANGDNQIAYCEPRRAWFEALLNADREKLTRHVSLVAQQMCEKQQATEAAAAKSAATAKAETAKATAPAPKPAGKRKKAKKAA